MGDGYRILGVNSYGVGAGCNTSPSYFTPLAPFIEWIESNSDRDLTPCSEPSSAWMPTPECLEHAGSVDSFGCESSAPTPSLSCGAPYVSESAGSLPEIELVEPAVAAIRLSGEDVAELSVRAEVISNSSAGLSDVSFEVTSSAGARATHRDEVEPFGIHRLLAPPGHWTIRAIARDHTGSVAEDTLEFQVVAAAAPAGCAIASSTRTPSRAAAWTLMLLLAVLRAIRRVRQARQPRAVHAADEAAARQYSRAVRTRRGSCRRAQRLDSRSQILRSRSTEVARRSWS
jgi:hypothetical protein